MPRVLLVDSEPSTRRLARLALAPAFEVKEAASAPQALALLAEGHFDVVLVDWDIDGQGVPAMILEVRRRQPDAACVVLSASSGEWQAAWLQSAGAASVPKPYRLADLVRAVQRAADRIST